MIGNPEANIHTLHKNNEKQVGSEVNELLMNYTKTFRGPFLVCLQSDQSVDYLRKELDMTILNYEVPVLKLKTLTIEGIEALGWKEKTLKAVL